MNLTGWLQVFNWVLCVSASLSTFSSGSNLNSSSKDSDLSKNVKITHFTAIISSLFSIPCVEKAFYENYEDYRNSHPIAAALANISAKLRITSNPVDLSDYFNVEILQKISDDKVSVGDLFHMLCDNLPPSIKSLFDLKLKNHFIKDRSSISIEKPFLELKFFIDSDGQDFFNDLDIFTPNLASSLSENYREIIESSKVIVFLLERKIFVKNEIVFIAKLINIEPLIIINGREYVFASNVLLENSEARSQIYNNKHLHNLDSNSLLLFYVLKEEGGDFGKDKNIRVPESLKSLNKKRTFDEAVSFDRLELKDYRSNQVLKELIENNRQRLNEDSISLLSKFTEASQVLGLENYSFVPGPNNLAYGAVELVLSVMASNRSVVEKLFERLRGETCDSFNFQLAQVIFRILLGSKTISLNDFVHCLAQKSGLTVEEFEYVKDGLKISQQIDLVISLIDSSFVDAPNVKIVEYSNLESDDPIDMRTLDSHEGINANQVIPARPAVIKGIWFDTKNSLPNPRRIRRIYSSLNTEMISIKIERLIGNLETNRTAIDCSSILIQRSDYKIRGFIGVERFDSNSSRIVAVAYNDFSKKYSHYTFGSKSKQYHPSKEYFYEMTRKYSLQIFFNKPDVSSAERPPLLTGTVPSRICATTLSQLMKEYGFKRC